MKRKNWIIASAAVITVVIIGVVIALIMVPRASAPSGNKNQPNSTTGPLTLYFTAVGDNGRSGTKIGCGDSLVPTPTANVTTSDKLKSTFDTLLANKAQYYGGSGLYNVLYKSSLTYVSGSTSGDTVTVKLSGSLSLAGECDNPRVQSVLELTARAATHTNTANVFINDKPLSQVLSLK